MLDYALNSIVDISNLKQVLLKASSTNLSFSQDNIDNAQNELELLSTSIMILEQEKCDKTIECEKWKDEATRKYHRVTIPSVLSIAAKDGINSIVMQLIDSLRQIKELEQTNMNLASVNAKLTVIIFL